jgi:hypothetical protein
MSVIYGPQPPTLADTTRATFHTAAVIADPTAGMAERLRAAEAEAGVITAYRHAQADPEADYGEVEAGQ